MRIEEIERQMAEQCSAMRAFPSQRPSLEQSFSGQNQRAAIEMQIESAKLTATQGKKIEQMNVVLRSLLELAEQQQIALKQQEEIDDRRYRENTRLSRIAAWSSVASIIVSVLLAAFGILFK